jgi:N-methylhydantoinase B
MPVVDPITFAVMRRRFESIAQEMTLSLERSSWTTMLALNRDFSCVIYDHRPRQVCMHDAVAIHTTSMHLVMEAIADAFADDVHDGDVFICNDPYRGNTHVGDVVIAAPVFSGEALRFWSVAKAHHMDIGAFVASSCTPASENVWQEGIQIPPVRLVDGGRPRKDIIELFLANVRYRELVEGDLMAQLGAVQRGRRLLHELCEEEGADAVSRASDELLEYADRRMSRAIEAIPDGVYHGEAWVDSDGVDVTDVPVRATVTIAGDQVHVDFSDSGPQAKGAMNGTLATTTGAATIPFLLYVDPDIPHNDGAIRHVTVTAAEGTIAHARHPASTSIATMVPSAALGAAVHKAMAQAIPERVIAGAARSANAPQFAGEDPRTGKPWGMNLRNGVGGSGANREAEGWPVITNEGAGGLKIQSIEQLELIYPLFVEEMQIAPGSMGYGTHNGGAGTRIAVRPRDAPMSAITFGDGVINPPHGIAGGTPGFGGGSYVEDRETGRRRYVSASGSVTVGEHETWVGVSSGGGGWGDPLRRAAPEVVRDVAEGLVATGTARAVFGVVIAPDGTLDAAATDALRGQRAASQPPTPPLVSPTEPGVGDWARREMCEGDVYLLNPTL